MKLLSGVVILIMAGFLFSLGFWLVFGEKEPETDREFILGLLRLALIGVCLLAGLGVLYLTGIAPGAFKKGGL